MKRWLEMMVMLAACLMAAVWAHAQIPVGPWVAASDKRIDEARKTDLRVIVMGRDGKAASGAQVHVEQLRGTFDVGYVLPKSGWSETSEEAMDDGRPLWRCVNAVSLDRLTDWPTMQPALGGSLNYVEAKLIDKAIDEARLRGMDVRWGTLISADLGRAPTWASSLSGEALADAVMGYCQLVGDRYGRRVDAFDAYAQWLSHDMLGERVGTALIRQLYETMPVVTHGAATGVRFSDALDIFRDRKMQRKLTDMDEGFMPVDVVSIEQHFPAGTDRPKLERALTRLDQLKRPVVFSRLSVGGDSQLDASISMETVLRLLMERPYVKGVWLIGWTPDNAPEPNGALFDEQGELLPAGRTVDRLFHDQWRTDVTDTADELGNVRLRAFPGSYRATVKLADGTVLETLFELKRSDQERVLLLETRRPVEPEPTH